LDTGRAADAIPPDAPVLTAAEIRLPHRTIGLQILGQPDARDHHHAQVGVLGRSAEIPVDVGGLADRVLRVDVLVGKGLAVRVKGRRLAQYLELRREVRVDGFLDLYRLRERGGGDGLGKVLEVVRG